MNITSTVALNEEIQTFVEAGLNAIQRERSRVRASAGEILELLLTLGDPEQAVARAEAFLTSAERDTWFSPDLIPAGSSTHKQPARKQRATGR
ncbi:MAG: hypothetical protein CMO80_15215 [Verrucomicrobiales bacterium]|nr:hypothetical protein [Verrucomicrobiales bacterium]